MPTQFRPCIDLHQGQVKQIVGSTLIDGGEVAENFATAQPASDFAQRYRQDALTGGHVVMLGPGNTEAAKSALQAYPGGLQVGGGVTTENAKDWIDAGASHVVVTSFVFCADGQIRLDRLQDLVALVGKDKIVLDLSCRRKEPNGPYYVVTNRWQTYTEYIVSPESLHDLAQYCDEFLVHGVEVEGQRCGILDDLVELLAQSPIPVTYAGGVRSLADLDRVEELGKGKVHCTVGSALDLFGGDLKYDDVVAWHKQRNP